MDNLNLQRAGTARPAILSVSGIRGRALSRREPGETAFLRDKSCAFFRVPRLSREMSITEHRSLSSAFFFLLCFIPAFAMDNNMGRGKTVNEDD